MLGGQFWPSANRGSNGSVQFQALSKGGDGGGGDGEPFFLPEENNLKSKKEQVSGFRKKTKTKTRSVLLGDVRYSITSNGSIKWAFI